MAEQNSSRPGLPYWMMPDPLELQFLTLDEDRTRPYTNTARTPHPMIAPQEGSILTQSRNHYPYASQQSPVAGATENSMTLPPNLAPQSIPAQMREKGMRGNFHSQPRGHSLMHRHGTPLAGGAENSMTLPLNLAPQSIPAQMREKGMRGNIHSQPRGPSPMHRNVAPLAGGADNSMTLPPNLAPQSIPAQMREQGMRGNFRSQPRGHWPMHRNVTPLAGGAENSMTLPPNFAPQSIPAQMREQGMRGNFHSQPRGHSSMHRNVTPLAGDAENSEPFWSIADEDNYREKTGRVSPSAQACVKMVDMVEKYMSDEYLRGNKYLQKQLQNNDGSVSIKMLASHNKLKKLCGSRWQDLRTAIVRHSEKIVVEGSGFKLRRLEPLSADILAKKVPKEVLAIRIPDAYGTREKIEKLFVEYGKMELVRLLPPNVPTPHDLSGYGGAIPDLGKSRCAVITYKSEDSSQLAARVLGLDTEQRVGDDGDTSLRNPSEASSIQIPQDMRHLEDMRVALLGTGIRRGLYTQKERATMSAVKKP